MISKRKRPNQAPEPTAFGRGSSWTFGMKKRTLPSIDFPAQITRLKQALSSRGVSVDEVSYSPEAYGSWSLTAGSKEKKLSFSYDAQLSELRYHDTKIVPKDWRDLQHASFRTWEGEDPLAYVEDVLKKEFPAWRRSRTRCQCQCRACGPPWHIVNVRQKKRCPQNLDAWLSWSLSLRQQFGGGRSRDTPSRKTKPTFSWARFRICRDIA